MINRRTFLRRAAGRCGSLLILPSLRAAQTYAANERLRLAVFGSMYNAEHFLTAAHTYNATISAICNPDSRKIAGVLKKWDDQAQKLAASSRPDDQRAATMYQRLARRDGVKVYADVREMFAQGDGDIDALVVSDYDHFHGVACGEAFRAGKPVCSERPLGLKISDARTLRAVAAKAGLPTTYRSPGTGNGAFRRAMELTEDGVLGSIKEVHIWFKRGGPDRDTAPQTSQPVPEGLNWDLWLGPLAWRDYHAEWMAYSHWRETSSGGLGVFGMHTTIFPFMALKLRELWNTPGAAIGVQAECARLNKISYPRWERVRWQIPARRSMPPVEVTWHHGPDFAPGARGLLRGKLRTLGISETAEADALLKEAGSMIIGSDGALVGDDHSVRITALPRRKFEKLNTTRPERVPDTRGIYRDWIDACRGGKPQIIASFDNGGPLSELIMLGNIATQFPGEKVIYDPAAGRVTSHPSANELLAFKYRDGWRI